MIATPQFVEQARSKHGDCFDYSTSRYTGFTKPIEVICTEHGRFRTTPKRHLGAKSGGCVACRDALVRKSLRLTTDEFLERARKVHGDRYDYSQVHYEGGKSKVTILCPKHGPFRMRAHRHLEGRGCRKCTFQRLGRERRLSFWDFVERTITVHGVHRYEYELQGFVNLHSKIPIHCPVHGLFHQSVASHLKGHGCPACVQSEGERRVREALRMLGISFREQMRFRNCYSKRSLPFDFFVPSHKLLIEFDGRQHYDNSELWGGDQKLAEVQRHDQIKNRFAVENGYRLVRIPFWDLDNVEDIVLEELSLLEEELGHAI